ncbi:metalloprotease family protein [Desulfitibacter alkalitolerans]|uniref:metalloprotease family protein n=1 Tax=Desulfitibacter alkalitolerans TaxID=264641 RepID=UPI000481FF93|nr:metalloprotease family protein [Desulfitibacter alkalitolerans]
MHLKKEIATVNTSATIILGFLLMLTGLASPWLFQRWMPAGSPHMYSYSALFVAGSLGIGAGLFFHEYYRHLMSKLLGLDSILIKNFGIKAVVTNYIVKWQAISITLAPFTDLTLIALLIMALTKSWLVTTGVITFLTINLMLSARDIITCLLIYKYAGSTDAILFTQEGFQVWTVKSSD